MFLYSGINTVDILLCYCSIRFIDIMSGSDGKDDQCDRAKEENVVLMGEETLAKNCTHNDPQCCFNVDFMRLGVDIVGDIEDAIMSIDITDYVPLTVRLSNEGKNIIDRI